MIKIFITVLIPVLLILGTGWLLGSLFDLHRKTLSTLSLYLFTPMLIFDSISRHQQLFLPSTLKILAIITGVILITLLAIEFIAHLFHLSHGIKSMIQLTLVLSNTGNWGLPINQAAYGEQGFAIAVIILVIMAVYSNTLGIVLSASDTQNPMNSFKTLLRMPLFYVLIFALIFNFFNLPIHPLIFKPIHLVANVAIPFNLLLLGIHLSSIRFEKNLPLVLTLSCIKLFILPVLAFGLAKLLKLQGTDLKITVTQLSMPTAVYASILAGHFDHRDQALVGQTVLVSTLLSLFSLTLIIRFFQSF